MAGRAPKRTHSRKALHRASLHAQGRVSAEELRRELAELDLTKETRERAPRRVSLQDLARSIASVQSAEQLFTALGVYFKGLLPSIVNKLEQDMVSADYKMLPEVYAGRALVVSVFTALLVYAGLAGGSAVGMLALSAQAQVMTTLAAVAVVLLFYYFAPSQKKSDKQRSIETNLPFALNHMAAIASSGAPPDRAFKILTQFKEFGGVTTEAANITMRIEVFGEDITTALQQVMKTTPSENFRKLLAGILAILRTGGNIEQYLINEAKTAMFDYELNMKRYIETLATYADIYTAILIAAPLFLVSILTVMSIIPGTRLPGDLTIDTVLSAGIYLIIPVLNMLFLAFVTATQPKV